MEKRKKICFVTTISLTIKSFLVDFGKYLAEEEGYDVTYICNTDESMYSYETEHIHYIPVKMKRGIAFDGLGVIWNLYKIFKREKFDIVQYSTKNASVYTCIAASMVGIKTRIYCQWGMMFVAMYGLKRYLIKASELLIAGLATDVESESFSIYNAALKENIYTPQKACVIWNGSACGVDLGCYDITKRNLWREEIRTRYNIPADSVVFGWCGRITRDKGHNELFRAFREINKIDKNSRLLMVGSYDNVESIDKELFEWAQNCQEVIFTGYSKEAPKMYSAMDVFCSLSYREGFGLVVIEAAAMQLPGIVTDVPGQIDTHINMETGISVHAKDICTVVDAMKFYINNPDKRKAMGIEARKQVEEKYDKKILFKKLAEHRNQLIIKNNA